MDPTTGHELCVELTKEHETEYHVISRSGHHVYVDNFEDFNQLVLESSLRRLKQIPTEKENNNNNYIYN